MTFYRNAQYMMNDVIWTYEGIDRGEHVFTAFEGYISWKVPPHLLSKYTFVRIDNENI